MQCLICNITSAKNDALKPITVINHPIALVYAAVTMYNNIK